MATNQNQSAARTRTEGDVHDALEDVSALVLGDGGELGAELRRTFVAAGATVIAPPVPIDRIPARLMTS